MSRESDSLGECEVEIDLRNLEPGFYKIYQNNWKPGGSLIKSDLGSPAVRAAMDPTQLTTPIAKESFFEEERWTGISIKVKSPKEKPQATGQPKGLDVGPTAVEEATLSKS
jgi:hypothetical protein